MKNTITLALVMLSLLGCGGGGGDDSPASKPAPLPVTDTDNDGIANSVDTDDDNDGVLDESDAFPLDPTESLDTDADGIGNNADTDDDGDGALDDVDAFPLDRTESIDTDSDGIGNNADTDDDGDGVLDDADAFPLDAAESMDTDADGIGNNADTDDDGDGVLDEDDAFPVDASETVDTDGDGIGNNADTDDDGDGVVDEDDAFPLDASETVDSDGDGIGNNADSDDDGDGVVDEDDAFPLDASESVDTDGDGIGDNSDHFITDASCFAETDGRDGVCYFTSMATQTISVVEYGSDGIVYFSGPQWGVVHRYDSNTEHFLTPVNVQASDTPTMAYSSGHQRFYIGDDNGDINYIDGNALTLFATLDEPAGNLIPVGEYLLSIDQGYYNRELATFNINGVKTEQNNAFNINSNYFAWNQAKSRLFHFRDGSSPNDLIYTEIDQSTGQIGSQVDSPYHGAYSIEGPISISTDGNKVVLGNGDIYNAETLEWQGAVSARFSHVFWLEDSDLVTLQASSDTSYLVRRNAELVLQEYISVDGELLAAFSTSDSAVLVLKTADKVSVNAFIASDDNDADGVINTEDAFAHNPAFSKDSDNDGFADEVHEGVEADAATLALVDAFPQDSACWLTEHGNGEVCDYNVMVPNFTADEVASVDGIVYLLNAQNKKIYRWLSATQSYTNPINLRSYWPFDISGAATHIAYSEAHERLYVGFDSGVIKYAENGNSAVLQEYANLSLSVDGLASVGDFILAQDATGAWVSHHIYNQDGILTDSKDWNYYSHTYAWNEDTSRVYFLRDNTSPNDLHFEQIDQSNGTITHAGESPYHSSGGIAHPVRVSSDNTKIILGSGRIFDATSLEEIADLELLATDIRWIGDEIFTLSVNDAGSSTVSIWSAKDYQKLGEISVAGTPVAFAPSGGDLVVVTMVDNTANYSNQLVADSDGDGLPGWWEGLYGLDDNDSSDASIDSDADSLSNSEEFTARTNPNVSDTDGDGLSDGDEVNDVLSDPLKEDTDGDGISDGDEVNEHGTDPLNTDSDVDGLSDYQELVTLGTDPLNSDSDNDGMPDAWEVANATNPLVNDTSLDNDSDGLINVDEFTYSSDPNLADSDSDGINDGDEVHIHLTDPTNADTDDDRMLDGWELAYGFNPKQGFDAVLDFDADGFSNVKEYFLKTDPTDFAEKPLAKTWSGYQGNAAHNGLNIIDINSSDLSLRWSIDLPLTFGFAKGKVIVSDSKVVVTGNKTNAHLTKEVLSLDALDGDIVWQKSYVAAAINPPAYSDGKVYFQTVDGGDSFVRALNIDDGTLVFKSQYNSQSPHYAAPTLFENNVYVAGGINGAVYRLDGSSGEQVWFTEGSYGEHWTPAVNEQSVFYINDALDVLDRATGELSASIATDDLPVNGVTPILGHENDVFVVSHNNKLIAFDLSLRNIKWQKEVDYSTSISVGLGEVYIISNNAINALDSRDGSLLWAWEPDNNESIQGNIVVSNNLLFVSGSSTTFAVDLETHQQVWSISESGDLSLGNEGALYILNQQDAKLVSINVSGDTDADGMLDWYEDYYGFDKLSAADAILDADNDGLTNVEEHDLSTNPTSNDTDADGLTDFDEVNIYASSPRHSDTDGDGMPDGWEVEQGFNLLDLTDASLDSDGDTVSNLEEYLVQTDPNDSSSVPDIITDVAYSFEDQLVPDTWVIDSSLANWYVDNAAASEGIFSLYTEDEAEISLSGFFAGNELTFKAMSSCGWSHNLKISIGSEIKNFSIGNNWEQQSLLIPRGVQTISIHAAYDDCTVRIDEVQLSQLENIQSSGIQYVTQHGNKLNFYDYNNQFVRSTDIPYEGNEARDLTVLDDGRIAIFNGVFTPKLSIYDPEQHTWQSLSHNGWGIVNNGTYGGIDNLGSSVFVTDMSISGSASKGIVKFDLATKSSAHFTGEEYIDLSIGLDNKLYALVGSQIDIYDPLTMELIDTVNVQDSRAVAADNEGNLYLATWNGEVVKYDSSGAVLATLSIGVSLYDINITSRSELLFTDRDQRLLKTTTGLTRYQVLLQQGNSQFVTDVDGTDDDLDGMPLWWESQFGFSDLDASDALTDFDVDGLINLAEYESLTNPTIADTDGDLINDGDEVNTYQTSPLLMDTDADGIDDYEELNTTLTDPLEVDTDGDQFSDGDEVNLYLTDPNDANSKPEALTAFNEGFETDPVLNWQDGVNSAASWLSSQANVSEGDTSFRSGTIGDSQISSTEFKVLVVSGVLSFDSLVLSESCCDRLKVYVNDELIIDTSYQEWATHSLNLEFGENTVRFDYAKDGSVSSLEDAVWIDNLIFSQ